MDAVHEGREEMPTAAQYVGLETRLVTQGDEAVGHRALPAEELFHDAHACVGDVAEGLREKDEQDDAQKTPAEND